MADAAPILNTLFAKGANKTNCSGFYKAVTSELGIPQPDAQADTLIEQITVSKLWVKIEGPDRGQKAAEYASQGYLVVALLKAKDHLPFALNKNTNKYDLPKQYRHGHMAIVLGRKTNPDGYPYVISGSEDSWGQSDGSKAIVPVWRRVDAVNVKYYRTIKTFPQLMPEPL